MDLFEEIDWELVVDFAKRFGGIVLAILFALAARRRKQRTVPEEEPVADEPRDEVTPIEPGTDATKLADQLSQGAS